MVDKAMTLSPKRTKQKHLQCVCGHLSQWHFSTTGGETGTLQKHPKRVKQLKQWSWLIFIMIYTVAVLWFCMCCCILLWNVQISSIQFVHQTIKLVLLHIWNYSEQIAGIPWIPEFCMIPSVDRQTEFSFTAVNYRIFQATRCTSIKTPAT